MFARLLGLNFSASVLKLKTASIGLRHTLDLGTLKQIAQIWISSPVPVELPTPEAPGRGRGHAPHPKFSSPKYPRVPELRPAGQPKQCVPPKLAGEASWEILHPFSKLNTSGLGRQSRSWQGPQPEKDTRLRKLRPKIESLEFDTLNFTERTL